MTNIQQVGTTQTGTKNVFIGAEVFTLVAQSDPFTGTLRIVVSGAAGNNPTNWIVKIIQGTSIEEWSGQTSGDPTTTLTLSDVFFVSGEAISITLENDETLDTAVTVSASLYSERMVSTLGVEVPIERSPTDTNPITFNFDGPSLTLVGTRSINNSAYFPVDGAVSFLRTEAGMDLYTLAYHVNDRPATEGVVRYRFVTSTYVPGDEERYVSLRVMGNTVGTNLDKTGYGLADNAITSAKIQDGALTAAKFASGAFNAVWTVGTRTLTAISDSAGITTLLSRITGLLQTKAQADTDQTAVITAISNVDVDLTGIALEATSQSILTGLGSISTTITPEQIEDIADAVSAGVEALGWDATAAKQDEILAKLSTTKITVTNVVSSDGGLIKITRGDTYSASDIEFTTTTTNQWGDLAGATAMIGIRQGDWVFTKAVNITSQTGIQIIQVPLTSAETEDFPITNCASFDIQITYANSAVKTKVRGQLVVLESFTPPG